MRGPLARSVEFDGQFDALRRPRLDAHRFGQILAGVERRVHVGDALADSLQELRQIFLLLRLICLEDAVRERERPERPGRFLLRQPPHLDLLAERRQHHELGIAGSVFRGGGLLSHPARRLIPLAELG